MKKKIVFYCAHAFGLYDILPLYKRYTSENYDVFIITDKKYFEAVKINFVINDENIFFINDYKSRLGMYFTDWFRLLFVSENFSEFYKQRKKLKFTSFKQSVSNYFVLFNISNDRVNYIYSKVIKLFYRFSLIKPFPVNFDKFYVVTKILHPYLITPFEDVTHLIVESWDHPAKEPFLLNPSSAESWNDSLNLELNRYQFYKKNIIGKALKFRYIEEYNKYFDIKILNNEELDDIRFIQNNNVAIYPMCTSSAYFGFSDELIFVCDLAKKLEKENVKLYIRPYPLAPFNDVLALKQIKNVKVGIANKICDGLEVFNEAHMLHKYLLIKHAKYVLNLGTTFVFDAALVYSECRIVQLKIDMSNYGDLGKYSRGIHITKYLHTDNAFDFSDFKLAMVTNLYKEYLINWLNN